MPYYAWKGVTLTGDFEKGRLFCRSLQELDQQLLKHDVALLQSREFSLHWWQKSSISMHLKLQFFRQLATLITSGVFLSQALDIVSQGMSSNVRFQKIITELADEVQQGISFATALARHPQVFDTFMIQMAEVGGQTGSLASALTVLCHQLDRKRDWHTRIRSALLLPVFTFLFFLSVATLLVVCIIPRFVSLFEIHNAELPYATKKLIALSEVMSSYYFFIGVVLTCLCIGILYRYVQYGKGKAFVDANMLRIPLIGDLIRSYVIAQAFQALVMLISTGMQLIVAVRTVRLTVMHTVLKEQLLYIEHQISAGISMSQAMQQLHATMFDQELIAAMRIGEKSGNLAAMLKPAVDGYTEKVKRSFFSMTTLLNPILMIIMGLLITALIIAVYMPIFGLAQIVQ